MYADGVNENVHEYISATTDRVNVRGYNYETNTPYEIIRVYFDQNGAAVAEEPAELKDFRVKSGSEADGAAEYYTAGQPIFATHSLAGIYRFQPEHPVIVDRREIGRASCRERV